MIGGGERIMVSTIEKVPFNHTSRYKWAIRALADLGCEKIIDGACGIGYGAQMAAAKGMYVWAYDRDEAVIPYQKKFSHPYVTFQCADLADVQPPEVDGAISIETIEHLQDDLGWLKKLRACSQCLVATVPNQAVVPFDANVYRWHFRHYTKEQFENLLNEAGWKVIHWATQYEKWDREKAYMRPGDDGMTLGVVCQ